VPLPNLKRGDRNLAVRAAQNALHRFLHKRGLPHRNDRKGRYGANTARDVAALKAAVGAAPVDGDRLGEHVWHVLKRHLGAYDRVLLARYRAAVAARRAAELLRLRQADGQKVADALMWLYENGRDRLVYTQRRPFPLTRSIEALRYRLDCSSTVTLAYWMAGCPDPNGFGFDGRTEAYGFTGTLWSHGDLVEASTARPGDLVFYGYDSRGPWPSHVAGVVTAAKGSTPARVVTFGHTPIKLEDIGYRPIRGVRRYV